MTEIALLIKSYQDDFVYAERLIRSVNTHNVDSLPAYIVVPEKTSSNSTYSPATLFTF